MMRQLMLLSLGACDLENPLNDGAPQAADVNGLERYYSADDFVFFQVGGDYPNDGARAWALCGGPVGTTPSGVPIPIPGSEPPEIQYYTVEIDFCTLQQVGNHYECWCSGYVQPDPSAP